MTIKPKITTLGRERVKVRGVVVALLAFALLVAATSAGPGEAAPARPTALVTGTFVGPIPGTEAFIAVVAAPRGAKASTSAARAYLCDGSDPRKRSGINEWFNRGSITGNTLQLSSRGGFRVQATLTRGRAAGSVTLASGKSFRFAANAVTGTNGLYSVTVSSNLQARGTSTTGARLEGRLAREPIKTGRYKGLHEITGALTPRSGSKRPFKLVIGGATPGQTGVFRLIVSPSGETRGGGSFKTKTGSQFTIPATIA